MSERTAAALRACSMWSGSEYVDPLPHLASLTNEQRRAVRWALHEWEQVAREERYEPIRGWGNFGPEVDHSALLNRLLDGKAAFVERPPRWHSYPDYDAMEQA